MTRRWLAAAALPIAATALLASSASAATAPNAVRSSNWAGYTASGAQFSDVSGTWVQPAANCAGGSGVAAFWIGIGGATGSSRALEQTGTQVECGKDGTPSYSAWYELVPAGPVTVDLAVAPGDRISARVGVNGDRISISMTDVTTGASFSKTLRMNGPETGSAEWIAEAPSACQSSGKSCKTLPLADFGTVAFSAASATAAGHAGPISDPQWTATPVQLSPGARLGLGGDLFGPGAGGGDRTSTAAAVPSTLTPDGSAFSVAWQARGNFAATVRRQSSAGWKRSPSGPSISTSTCAPAAKSSKAARPWTGGLSAPSAAGSSCSPRSTR